MAVFIEHDISGHTFLILPQEDGHKLWVRIFTMIDDHKTKVAQNTVHIQFINSINGDQYEKVMSYNTIFNNIVQKRNNTIIW